MLRRHHYECAFEEFLRSRRIPYVAVDEARRALLPNHHSRAADDPALKSFDFVVYGGSGNLLIDIKGRRAPGRRLESWATLDDVESLKRWEQLFGPGFEAVFVFIYASEAQPPDALFQEVMEHRGTWYALRSVPVREYAAVMKLRSRRWRTVDVPAATFAQISQPFTGADLPRPSRREYDPGSCGISRDMCGASGSWQVPVLAGLDDLGGLPV
jgi:hypothetical protein